MQKIIIFGKSNCQFCRKAKVLAKRVVSNIDANFQYHELSKEETISELQKLGLNIQDFKTYPQIVIETDSTGVENSSTDSNVDYVGGYTEFAQYVQAKEWLKRNIFKKRVNAKPYEYPELLDYVDAIRQSYWTHDEFNFDPDKQDFLINISEKERQVIQRSMLAISQVEVTVKRFWADLYKYFPKPEIDLVGVTFAESECRHFQSYGSLLELLGLDDLFENLDQYPALMERVNYMEKFVETKNLSNEGFTASLILFSMFVEHISLFGQFYTMMSFNKRKNMFKGLSNAIEATSKEEEIHGQFGLVLYNILREEHSEMFTAEFFKQIQELADLAYDAEMQILDWIFEDAEDLGFVSKNEVKTFMEDRYNKSLTSLGLEPKYQVDENLLKETKWFELELLTTKEEDFFSKRSTAYSNNSESFDDIF